MEVKNWERIYAVVKFQAILLMSPFLLLEGIEVSLGRKKDKGKRKNEETVTSIMTIDV